jgi:hypothetical protein
LKAAKPGLRDINPAPRFDLGGENSHANLVAGRDAPRCGDQVIAMRMATNLWPDREPVADHEQKRLAFCYLRDAWGDARHDGVDGDCLAQTALFLALAELISTYGEEPAARYAENLSNRIRNGEFSVESSRQ